MSTRVLRIRKPKIIYSPETKKPKKAPKETPELMSDLDNSLVEQKSNRRPSKKIDFHFHPAENSPNGDTDQEDSNIKNEAESSASLKAETPELMSDLDNSLVVQKSNLRPRKKIDYHFHSAENTSNGDSDQEDSSIKYEPESSASSETESSSSDSELFSKKERKLNNDSIDASLIKALQDANDSDEENEYRRQRQKNMQDRFKVLSALEFTNDVEELKKVTITPKATPKRKPVKKPPTKSYPKYFIKRSLRLQNRSLNLSDSIKSEPGNESSKEDSRADTFTDENIQFGTESSKKDSRPDKFTEENIRFIDEDAEEDLSNVLKTLKDDMCTPYAENNDFCSCDLDKYCEIVQSCKMRDAPLKVIAQRIVSMDFHPSQSKLILLVGDKSGNIALRQIAQNTGIERKVHAYNVNCVSFGKQDNTKFFSTSLDGTVRQGDVNNCNLQLTYTAPENDHTTWHHEFGHSLFVAEGEGIARLLDLRAPSDKYTGYKCHSRSIRTIQVHPTDENYFLTSSGVGEFVIWDIRGSRNKPIPISGQLFDKALTSAFFSSKGNYVLTTGNDDTIRVFNVWDMKGAVEETKLSHNNHGGRWLSVFKARWHPQREDAFLVGSMMNNPKRIQIYRRNGKMINELVAPEMSTYSPVVVAHPTQPIIVGGNGSGKVHIFSPYSSLTDMSDMYS